MKTEFINIYGYGRYSDPSQSLGDSKKRQITGFKSFLKTIDKKFEDLPDGNWIFDEGLSGYDWSNFHKGLLGKLFLDLKEGDLLWVEQMRSISRYEPEDVMPMVKDIIKRGVTFVVGFDIVTKDNYHQKRGMLFQNSDMVNLESFYKSKNNREAWVTKKEEMIKGIKTPFRCPFWLKFDSEKVEFVLIKDKAQAIKTIFNRCIEGDGCMRIAKYMNIHHRSSAPSGKKMKGWNSTNIYEILNNQAILGTLDFGEIIKRDYYPPVFDSPDIFYQAKSILNKRKNHSGNRSPTGEHENIFQNILKCKNCGRNLRIHISHQKGRIYRKYCCSSFRDGRCKSNCRGVDIDFFEDAATCSISGYASELLLQKPNSRELKIKEYETTINGLSIELSEKAKMKFIPEVGQEMLRSHNERTTLEEQLEIEKGRFYQETNVDVKKEFLDVMRDLPNNLKNVEYRVKLKNIIPLIVDRIEVDLIDKRFSPVFKSIESKSLVWCFDNGKRKIAIADDWQSKPKTVWLDPSPEIHVSFDKSELSKRLIDDFNAK